MLVWAGTERFEVVRQIDSGASGVVYEVLDRTRGSRVALKLLRRFDPAFLYRFKREFRVLADLSHPNLVTLHELVNDQGHWFFTMELVEGANFVEAARPGRRWTDVEAAERGAPPIPLEVAGAARLRDQLRQLVEAVSVLHRAGLVHRDLKRQNVLVDAAGRVVVLDFGLAAELLEQSSDQIVGTPDYVSPEAIAGGGPVGPAADWYAVGVMLYEALWGRTPFDGAPLDVMIAKTQEDPRMPARPADAGLVELAELAMALLRRDPAQRPGADEILARLGGPAQGGEPIAPDRAAPPFIGRRHQLALLHQAFAQVAAGRPAAALVHGGSGMGKSALVRHFLEELEPGGRTVVLEGRCYPRESVPFRALDSLVDSLTRHLLGLGSEVLASLLPENMHVLVRSFPVLRRLELGASLADPGAPPERQEQRRRAIAALRELLGRLAARASLVLFIDDLQWGDADSAAVLAELTRPPDPPPLLLLATFRRDDAPTSPLLQQLLGPTSPLADHAVDVPIDALPPDEALELARALVPGAAEEHVREIAWEAGGNPLFALELARLGDGSARGAAREPFTIERVLGERLRAIPEAGRRLLQVIAIAGRPIPLALAEQVAQAGDDGRAAASLRATHLIRFRGARDPDLVEPYHDQIREVVTASVPVDELARLHGSLAAVLEASPAGDPEALAQHWRQAGELRRAARHALAAADRAAELLAFARAAELYAACLELDPRHPDRHAVEVRLADALVNAGRGGDAAAVYLAAVPGAASAAEAVELERRAAEQLLRCGRVHEGIEVFERVLRATGLSIARTPRRALASLLGLRARVRLRGLGFRERRAAEIDARTLTRIDTCWSASAGIGFVDVIRGAEFQTRGLLLALRAGDTRRVGRALAAEAAYRSSPGGEDDAEVQRLIAVATELGARADDPHTLALCGLAATVSAFCRGWWKQAAARAVPTIALFRDRCSGAHWELTSVRHVLLWSQAYLGQVGDLPARVRDLLRESEELGDFYTSTFLRTGLSNLAWLVEDDVTGAREAVAQGMAEWSGSGFQMQHYNALEALVHIDLYAGRPTDAHQRLEEAWPALRRSLLLGIQQVRIEALFLRGVTALAAGVDGAGARARRAAAAIERLRMRWGMPLAALLRAGACAREDQPEQALPHLERAAAGFRSADMRLFAALAELRLGAARGGDAGRDQADAALTWMNAHAIARPEAWAAMWTPGFDG